MPPSKRRKGKHASTRSTSTRQSTAAAAAAVAAQYAVTAENKGSGPDENAETMDVDTVVPTTMIEDENDIILTSSKRRGVYECDFCHCDISQLPRIRCAVCKDFDMCLDCFTAPFGNNSSPTSSSARKGLDSMTSSHPKHNPYKHGYRVCDSTRFPIFPTARQWSTKAFVQCVAVPVTQPSNAASAHVALDAEVASSSTPSTRSESTENNAMTSDQRSQAKGITSTDEPNTIDRASSESTSIRKQDHKTSSLKETEERGASDQPKEGLTTVLDDDGQLDIVQKEFESQIPADATPTTAATSSASAGSLLGGGYAFRADDPKMIWTVEEDLRLLEGIQNHGIGNWVEIAETVAGQGKTPKRCMERYLDDYLGRYGHILPLYTLIPYEDSVETGGSVEEGSTTETADSTEVIMETTSAASREASGDSGTATSGQRNAPAGGTTLDASSATDDMPRASKRRSTHFRSPGGSATSNYASTLASRKKYKVVPTDTIEGYREIWPNPYYPSNRAHGTEVGRDQMYKAEQAYVKAIGSVQSEEVRAIREEWIETKLNKPGGPSVLPERPEDVMAMPGAELAGFMPRRGDFDIEWENDAEDAIGDMEFLPGDSEEDKQLKLKILAIYNSKLDRRETRKNFIISRKLWDYRRLHQDFEKLPRDEHDLVLRMRLFERFHTPEEHKIFLNDILKAKRLRKEIAKLQMYRRLGIRSLVEAEKYELDKARRQFHRTASAASQQNRDNDGQRQNDDANAGGGGDDRKSIVGGLSYKPDDTTASTSLWRRYRTTERRVRKSVNRGVSFESGSTSAVSDTINLQAQTVRNDMVDVEPRQPEKDRVDDQGQGDNSKLERSGDAVQEPIRPRSPLSPQEVDLCERVGLTHDQYRDIKRVLIQESLEAGLLDKEGAGSSRRSLIKMDVVRRGNLIDFFLRAGWVSTRLSHIARGLPQCHSQT